MRILIGLILGLFVPSAIGCAERVVSVRYGTKVVCSDCGKTLGQDIKHKRVVESQAKDYRVRTTSDVCPDCQAKRAEKARREAIEAKLNQFIEYYGPANIVKGRDRNGVEQDYVLYIDGIYGERRKVPVAVVAKLANAYDFDGEKYRVAGPLRLSNIRAYPGAPRIWVTWVGVTTSIGGSDYADAYIANTSDEPIRKAMVQIDHYDDDKLKRTDKIDFLKGSVLPPHTFARFRKYVRETPGMQYQWCSLED